MEEGMIRRSTPQLEDVPELIHCIQSMLPVKDAARTCILSKSWLHAWSTIPTLRFSRFDGEEKQKDYAMVVDRTLRRYHRDEIPFESIDLEIDIKNQELAFLVENWVRSVATKSCLNQLSLKVVVSIASFTLPDELLSGENLETISVTAIESINISSLRISSNLVIKSVFLRELHFFNVQMSVEVFDNLVSTCSLLEIIELIRCKGLNTIKIKNLEFLYELIIIDSVEPSFNLEIDDAPNLRYITYDLISIHPSNPLPFSTVSLPSLTRLKLHGVMVDDSFFDMIGSKFPFLKSLILYTDCCRLESFKIRCVPLKGLFLNSHDDNRFMDIQVYAPKLCFFGYSSETMARLMFPIMAPMFISIMLFLESPIDDSFFLKMRETLEISSVFNIVINIENFVVPRNIDIDDLRKRVAIPATNVQELEFGALSYDYALLQNSLFFDAFFCICHPKRVVACLGSRTADGSYLCKVIVRVLMELMEKKTCWPVDHLTGVEIKNHRTNEWEPLTRSFFDGPILHDDRRSSVVFKLNWLNF